MTTQRLTDLPQLTATAANDLIHVVDVSDTTDGPQGSSRKVQIQDFLPDSDLTPGTYGSTTEIPVVTVNTKGLLTGIDTVPIPSVDPSQFDPAGAATQAVADHEAASDPHSQYLTDARGDARYDASGAASSAITAHVEASDPHTQYLTNTRGDARYLALSSLPLAISNGGTGKSSTAPVYDANANGIKADGIKLTDVTTTASSATISSASYIFTSADVSKHIMIAGAGSAGGVYAGSISSVSNGIATLSLAAGTSIAGTGVATFGMDDAAAWNALIAAITSVPFQGRGTMVFGGNSVVGSTLTWQTQLSIRGHGAGKSILTWISTGNMTSAVIQAVGTNANPLADCAFSYFEIDVSGAIGSYTISSKCLYVQKMLRPMFVGLYLHDSPATALGCDYIHEGVISGCIIENAGRLNSGSNGGGAGIGIAVGALDDSSHIESTTVTGNLIINAKRFGIFYESQTTSTEQHSVHTVAGNYVLKSATGDGITDSGVLYLNITGNVVTGTNSGDTGNGISVKTSGTPPGGARGLISANTINGCNNGICIDQTVFSANISDCSYALISNTIFTSQTAGINIITNSTTPLGSLKISGNSIRLSNSAGLLMSGTAGATDVDITDNKLENNATTTSTDANKAGITIGTPITRLKCFGNTCADNRGTPKQLYGLVINNVAVTGTITNNDLKNNGSQPVKMIGTASFIGIAEKNEGCRVTTLTAAGPYTVSPFDELILVNQGTGAPITLNFPANAAGFTGKQWTVKDRKLDAATNNITLAAGSGNIVNTSAASTLVMNTAGQVVRLESDGTDLMVI